MDAYDIQNIRDAAALLQSISSGLPITDEVRARCARVAGWLDDAIKNQD